MTEQNYQNGHTALNGHNGHLPHYEEDFKTLTWTDYIRIFRRRWWLVILCLLFVSIPTAYFTFTAAPVYQAATVIMVQDDGGGMERVLFEEGAFFGKTSEINDQVYLLKSRYITELVIKELWSSAMRDSLPILFEGASLALAIFRENLAVSPVEETNCFIQIAVKGSTPFESAFLANTIASVYQNQDQELSQGEIKEVVEFLHEQLSKKEQDLKRSEEMLKNYQERVNITDLSGDVQETVNQLATFESLYNGVLTDLKAYEKRLEYLNQQLGLQKENLQGNIAQISSPLILKLRDELAEIERKASVLIAQGVSEDYADMRALREKQVSIKTRLIAETQKLVLGGLMPDDPLAHAQEMVSKVIEAETEISALRARADALEKVVQTYNQKMEQLPEKSLRLARLQRSKKVDENLYYMMKEKFEESRITMAGQIGKVRIIDRAVPPDVPISPKKKKNIMLGSLSGIVIGVLLVLFLENIDKSVHHIDDIERMGLPLLGAIPHIDSFGKNGMFNRNGRNLNEYQKRLIALHRPKAPISEAYRTVRTNIQFSEKMQDIKTVLVTSPGPAEGKSTTVTNLAITKANMGLRTLLVDADLRRPIVHRFFDTPKAPGLTNLLMGEQNMETIFQQTSINNLFVLPSGILPPNPSELLGSKKMKTLIEQLKNYFDFVLFDSPPLIAVTDSQILSTEVDGTIMVIKSGQSQLDAVKRARVLLGNVKSKLLGVVLNDLRTEHMYGSYYYYYYHNYYGRENDTDTDFDTNGEKPKKRKKRKQSYL